MNKRTTHMTVNDHLDAIAQEHIDNTAKLGRLQALIKLMLPLLPEGKRSGFKRQVFDIEADS